MGGDKKKSGKGFKHFPTFVINPSTEPNRIEQLVIGNRGEAFKVIEKSDDEFIAETWDSDKKPTVIDRFQFVKLFPEAQLEIMQLNSSGISVLSYIFCGLGKMRDEIAIMQSDFKEFYNSVPGFENKDSVMVCYRGILNLLEHNFIFKKVGEGVYFINVNKFFNGDRTNISWVNDIKHKLKLGELVPKNAVKFNGRKYLTEAEKEALSQKEVPND